MVVVINKSNVIGAMPLEHFQETALTKAIVEVESIIKKRENGVCK